MYRELNTKIVYSDANYIADFSDSRKVLWTSENVFIAKVVKNNWTYITDEPGPQQTVFDVEVIYNIKGQLSGTKKVLQIWWYDSMWTLYLPHWTTYLQEWDIYLLTTSWGEPYHILSHENGSHLISSKTDYDSRIAAVWWDQKKAEKELIKNSTKVKEFRKAYKDEIYFETYEGEKYKISSEKNAYKNLNVSEKKSLENLENWFVK